MIYVFTAMYCEARPLIQYYQLKKEVSQTRFQVFYHKDAKIRLTITGTGMIAAAAAVGSICTEYGVTSDDFLINIGTAAGKEPFGQICLCNKIIEAPTGRTFYPDILYCHTFRETGIITDAKYFKRKNAMVLEDEFLHDMEASSVYQAGSYFFGPHQMIFLKVISDFGVPNNVTLEDTESLITARIKEITAFADRLSAAVQNENQNKINLKTADDMTEKLSADLHCSHSMSLSLRQYIRYAALSNMNYESIINEMYQKQRLPCKDKKEGKIYFEEFKRKLL